MSVLIEWLGHACFRITNADGLSILIDPYDDSIGYRIPDYTCDILLITHDHFDHAAEQFVDSNHDTIRTEGTHKLHGIEFKSERFFHDPDKGKYRGETLVYRFNVDGLEFAHVGDLGEVPSGARLDFLRGVNCLMIPIGGVFTITAKEATEIVKEIKPSYVFPMHYKTKVLNFQIGSLEDFTKGKSDVIRISHNRQSIEPGDLPSRPNIIVMDFE